MEWNFLPVAGGLYDQSPKLLDDFQTIMMVENMLEKKKREKEEAERKNQMGKGRGPRR